MVDMDNVITDGRFDTFLEEFLGYPLDIENNPCYFRQEFIQGREDEFKEIYQYQNLYEDAPLLPGCYEVLQRLAEVYDVYIVTSYIWGRDIINAEENLKNKYQYLKKELPFIHPSHYIFTQNKKLLNFDIRIDDRLSGLTISGINLLFDAWSNRAIREQELKEKNIIRVMGWDDIEKILL